MEKKKDLKGWDAWVSHANSLRAKQGFQALSDSAAACLAWALQEAYSKWEKAPVGEKWRVEESLVLITIEWVFSIDPSGRQII